MTDYMKIKNFELQLSNGCNAKFSFQSNKKIPCVLEKFSIIVKSLMKKCLLSKLNKSWVIWKALLRKIDYNLFKKLYSNYSIRILL